MLLSSRQHEQGNHFQATCSATDLVGDFVRVLSSDTVKKIDIDATAIEVAIGVIVSKSSSTSCLVQRGGTFLTTGLTPGALYYVGPSAQSVTPRPSDPASGLRTIQSVGFALNSTQLMLSIVARPVRIRS